MEDAKVSSNHKTFIYDKIGVFFKHTDYHGFVHPYNFLEWMSYTREAYFSQVCKDFHAILDSPVKMMTAKVDFTNCDDGIFGDPIEARLTITRIKKVSFDVIIRFLNGRTKKMICETQHTLVFVDSRTNGFTAIPKSLNEAIVEYQEK